MNFLNKVWKNKISGKPAQIPEEEPKPSCNLPLNNEPVSSNPNKSEPLIIDKEIKQVTIQEDQEPPYDLPSKDKNDSGRDSKPSFPEPPKSVKEINQPIIYEDQSRPWNLSSEDTQDSDSARAPDSPEPPGFVKEIKQSKVKEDHTFRIIHEKDYILSDSTESEEILQDLQNNQSGKFSKSHHWNQPVIEIEKNKENNTTQEEINKRLLDIEDKLEILETYLIQIKSALKVSEK